MNEGHGDLRPGTKERGWAFPRGEFHMALRLDRMRACLGGSAIRTGLRSHPSRARTREGRDRRLRGVILRLSGRRSGSTRRRISQRPNRRTSAIAGKPIRTTNSPPRSRRYDATEPVGIETTFSKCSPPLRSSPFKRVRVDVMVLEVGLGGRTRRDQSRRSQSGRVTSLALDHTQVLGDTVGKIAAEKAGIVKAAMTWCAGRATSPWSRSWKTVMKPDPGCS